MKKQNKFISLILASALLFQLTACVPEKNAVVPDISSQDQMSSLETSSEYPSSSEEISSHESASDVSSIVSEIEKSSSKEASSKETSPKTTSSKQQNTASKPVASKPVSSKPASSKPDSSQPDPSEPDQGNHVTNKEMKAVWIAFLEFDSFKGSSESGFRSRIATYFDTSINKGLNTVIVQIRPHGDSMYQSSYFPWSKHVSGTMGVGVSYDPLAIMVEEAHARGLEIHAWLNPYRTMTDGEFSTVDDSYPTKQWYNSGDRNQYMIKRDDGRWWLKPGNSEVQRLIVDGAKEIVQNYRVDGIHIDDYFYSGKVSDYGDSTSQAKANTTAMVKGLYDGVKSVNSAVRFGVSPAGGFRQNNALPNSDMGYLSTDLALWCTQDGYIDYVMPQIYWDYNHSTQPFTMTLQKWESFVTADSVDLYIGLAPYRLSASVINQQIAEIAQSGRSGGYALFRYDHILGL